MLAIHPDDLNLILRAHVKEEEENRLQKLSSDVHSRIMVVLICL